MDAATFRVDRQMRQKRLDLGLAHFSGMALSIKEDETPNPVDISLFRSDAVVSGADHCPDKVKQAGLSLHGESPFSCFV